MSLSESQLVDRVWNKLDKVKKYVVADVVREALQTIIETTAAGEKVSFVGFGVFKPVVRLSRQCRNPQTGEMVNVPDRKFVRFRPGTKFKKAVAG